MKDVKCNSVTWPRDWGFWYQHTISPYYDLYTDHVLCLGEFWLHIFLKYISTKFVSYEVFRRCRIYLWCRKKLSRNFQGKSHPWIDYSPHSG